MYPYVSRKLKRWQRAFITLHGLKINWGDSTNIHLSVSMPGHQWYMDRQAPIAYWLELYKIMGTNIDIQPLPGTPRP